MLSKGFELKGKNPRGQLGRSGATRPKSAKPEAFLWCLCFFRVLHSQLGHMRGVVMRKLPPECESMRSHVVRLSLNLGARETCQERAVPCG